MLINSRLKKLALITSIFIATLIPVAIYFYNNQQQGPIYEFNPITDTKPLLDIFNKESYWLLANNDSSPAFMLKYRTFDNNPIYFGALKIKVLRENNKIAGFTAYHLDNGNKKQGRILFVAVDQKFRGKGYGTVLAQYAMQQLFNMGVDHIALWTRTDNLPAQKIYTALGFKEAFEENGYIFFEYWPKN